MAEAGTGGIDETVTQRVRRMRLERERWEYEAFELQGELNMAKVAKEAAEAQVAELRKERDNLKDLLDNLTNVQVFLRLQAKLAERDQQMAALREAIVWLLPWAQVELRTVQHEGKLTSFDECDSADCVRLREVEALASVPATEEGKREQS